MGRAAHIKNHCHVTSYLIVDETPLLQEGVHTHDGADVASEVAAAGRDGEILDRVEPVGVDHKVAIVLVHGGGLAAVPIVEELGQRLALDAVDRVHVEPGAVAGEHDGVGLRDQVFPCGVLDKLLGLGLAGGIALAGTITPRTLILGRVAHLLVEAGRLGRGAFGRVEGVV